MKCARKPTPQPRPPAAQMELFNELLTFPIFSGSVPRVSDSPFKPTPANKRPAVDLFGNDTRPTLEQMQHKAGL